MFQDKFVLADGTALQSNIVGVEWTTSSNSDSDIAPGSVCASAVEIEFWVNSDSALRVTQGTVLTYYKVDIDFDIETKIGVFTCDKPEKTGANKYKVTAYDNVTLLDVDVTEWLNALTFPITIKDFATALAANCGLELANEPRLNKDYQVQKFTGSGVKARDLMKMVCSASGCFCNADANGKLFFDWYKKNEKVVIAPRKSVNASSFYLFDVVPRSLQDNVPRALVTTESGNDAPDGIPYFANQLTFSDFVVKAIDKVQVKQSDDDVGVIYPADEQGTNALVIQGNQLLSTTSDAALRPYVKNLYDGLNNITYVPCSNIHTPETLEIKVGDIVTVSDGKKEFVTWITSVKHSGGKCTFESVGNANRNTTTAVNNAQYNARQKMVELKASVDGISAKLSDYSTTEQMNSAIKASASEISATVTKTVTENIAGTYETIEGTNEKLSNYYTKQETETAITANLDKIELGITEKTEADNLFAGGEWTESSTGSTGSVLIDGDTVTISAPSSDEQAKYSGASWGVPPSKLKNAQGAIMEFSFEYKVNSEISTNTVHPSHIIMWAYYASGNVSTIAVTLATSSYAEPVGDWKKASATYQFKAEVPTRIYAFAYLYGGTGSVSVRGLSLKQASSKSSIISLKKDGTTISSSELNLDKYATNSELKVGIDGISATVVKNGEVRSKFALDPSSVSIESGTITFKGNTLVVDSDNFKLTSGGAVTITGTFTSTGTSYGLKNKAEVTSGAFNLIRTNSEGAETKVVSIFGLGANVSLGAIRLRGPNGESQIDLQSSLTGGNIWLFDAYGNTKIALYGSEGNARFDGNVDFKGNRGIDVTRRVSCETIKASYFALGSWTGTKQLAVRYVSEWGFSVIGYSGSI